MIFFNVGLVVGAIVVILKKNWKRNVLIIVQLTYFELVGAFFIIISPKGVFWFMGIGPLIIGLVMAITNTLMLTLIQKVIAPRKQGRVISIVILISSSVAPLSMILSGFFAEILGIYLFFWVCLILSFGIITLGIKSTSILSIDKITKEKLKKTNLPKVDYKKDGEITKKSDFTIDNGLKDGKI